MDENDCDIITIDMDEYLALAVVHDQLANINDLIFRLYSKRPESLGSVLAMTGEEMRKKYSKL